MMFSASSQVIIISPILPNISTELGIAEAALSWLVTSYAIMLGIFALIIGPISDKVGRRQILLLGCSALSVTLFLHGLANSFWSLLVVRSLSGAAGGMLSGAAVSYVGDYFPYERRGWANGWVMSGVAAGQILGIPMGKFLAGLYGFRLPFVMFGVTMAFAVVFVWRFVPQPDVKRNSAPLTIKRSIKSYLKLLEETKNCCISSSLHAYVCQHRIVSGILAYMARKGSGIGKQRRGTLIPDGRTLECSNGPYGRPDIRPDGKKAHNHLLVYRAQPGHACDHLFCYRSRVRFCFLWTGHDLNFHARQPVSSTDYCIG